MFFKINNDEQIKYIYVKQIVVTDMGTFIKTDNNYPINDNFIPITQEEWDALEPPIIEPTYSDPIPETTEEKLIRIEEQNIILMDALATTFEEVIALRELVEGGTK